MPEAFPDLVIRSFSDLADAFLAVKNHRGLSNLCLEEIAGVSPGFVDKYLGRTRSKKLSETSFNLLIGALGLELVVRQDPEAVQKMAHRWERRQEQQIRDKQPLSAAILERARAIVLSEMAHKGWQTRKRQARNGHNGNGYKG